MSRSTSVFWFVAIGCYLAILSVHAHLTNNSIERLTDRTAWYHRNIDSLQAAIPYWAEREAYVRPASVRIGNFLDPEEAYKVASTIWNVSVAFSPRTNYSVTEFAMLMEALGEHESGFDETALSKSGVPGPWQCSYTLAKALANDPTVYRYAVVHKKDLMDYQVSAWYGAAAICLFLDAYDQDLNRALLAWHDGETLTNSGRTTAAARYLRSNVLAIIERNKGDLSR